MDYSFYLVLTQAFCEAHSTYQIGQSRFGYGITTDGRYVTSTNALNDFPELFSGNEPIVKLSMSDFPSS